MNASGTLSSFAALLSSIAAIFSLLTVIKKQQAERKLHKELKEKEVFDEDDVRTNLLPHLLMDPPDAAAISKAQEQIEALLWSLEEPERKNILEGLRQPSERGQVNYILKLLAENKIFKADQPS